jgi:hypothetical protein
VALIGLAKPILLNRTDIEQEVNGLYTFGRKKKIDSDKVKEAVDAAISMYYEHKQMPRP